MRSFYDRWYLCPLKDYFEGVEFAFGKKRGKVTKGKGGGADKGMEFWIY